MTCFVRSSPRGLRASSPQIYAGTFASKLGFADLANRLELQREKEVAKKASEMTLILHSPKLLLLLLLVALPLLLLLLLLWTRTSKAIVRTCSVCRFFFGGGGVGRQDTRTLLSLVEFVAVVVVDLTLVAQEVFCVRRYKHHGAYSVVVRAVRNGPFTYILYLFPRSPQRKARIRRRKGVGRWGGEGGGGLLISWLR